jgi:succinate-semialdehyde dehydrogenase/glutarate-semialdehyde dehydrogenase
MDAGLPPGSLSTVNVNAADAGSQAYRDHPCGRKLSFTGSTEIGKLLYRQCAGTVKKLTLELGGNAPLIVFDDADLGQAVAGTIASKYRNAGQTCVCANRILVQSGIYDRYAAALAEAVKKLAVGPGMEPGTQIGPLINEAAIAKVETLMGDALKQGAKVLTGGELDKAGPLFYRPSVVGGVTPKMSIVQEEIFGPVAALIRFDTEDEAIRLANDTPFGLAAYLFSQNLSRAWRVAERLDAGMVGVNEGIFSNEVVPFGGVKESGLGREGAAEGLDEYLEVKYVCLGAIDA